MNKSFVNKRTKALRTAAAIAFDKIKKPFSRAARSDHVDKH